MYLCTYVPTYVCTYVCTYVPTYVHTYLRMYIRTYVHMCMTTDLRVCTYLRANPNPNCNCNGNPNPNPGVKISGAGMTEFHNACLECRLLWVQFLTVPDFLSVVYFQCFNVRLPTVCVSGRWPLSRPAPGWLGIEILGL